MDIKKHYGFLENTGTRVIVIFRFLPAEPNNALIVSLDAMPDAWRDEVVNATNTQAGQTTVDLYTVLQHRSFSDGTNVLSGLHTHGLLRKVPVSQVIMTPITGQKVPLALINASVNNKVDEYIQETADAEAEAAGLVAIDPEVLAKGLIAEATLLKEQADSKFAEAYALAPHLKPKAGRPPKELDAETKAARRKEMRLESDHKLVEKRKVEKVENAITEKVNKKILRDAERPAPIEVVEELSEDDSANA